MAVNQVQQREQENPDDIDEVPVKARDIDRRVVIGGVDALLGLQDDKHEDAHAHNHVQSVQARHGKVEREKQLRLALQLRAFEVESRAGNVVFDIFIVPFHALDTDKR